MSRQQSDMPEERPDRAKPGKKDKPWSLWHWWGRGDKGGWYRVGRYRTSGEAAAVREQQHRKHGSLATSEFAKRFGGGWSRETYRVRHERDGKPTEGIRK